MRINLRYSDRTVTETLIRSKRFLKSHTRFTEENISQYLEGYITHSSATYNAELKVIRRLGKYLKLEQITKEFQFAPVDTLPNQTPSTEEISLGYQAQEDKVSKAIYLFIASTGLRKGEVLNLSRADIDWNNRAVVPNHFTRTKRSGITFFNEETQVILSKYLSSKDDQDGKLFTISDKQWRKIWDQASKKARKRITAKSLRLWHSVELGEKGIGDRYIDIFQGRAPRTTLARHYTSHGIDRLRTVYDNASLRIDIVET